MDPQETIDKAVLTAALHALDKALSLAEEVRGDPSPVMADFGGQASNLAYQSGWDDGITKLVELLRPIRDRVSAANV